MFLGLAVGWWLLYIGLGLAALALVGWVFEYWRGCTRTERDAAAAGRI